VKLADGRLRDQVVSLVEAEGSIEVSAIISRHENLYELSRPVRLRAMGFSGLKAFLSSCPTLIVHDAGKAGQGGVVSLRTAEDAHSTTATADISESISKAQSRPEEIAERLHEFIAREFPESAPPKLRIEGGGLALFYTQQPPVDVVHIRSKGLKGFVAQFGHMFRIEGESGRESYLVAIGQAAAGNPPQPSSVRAVLEATRQQAERRQTEREGNVAEVADPVAAAASTPAAALPPAPRNGVAIDARLEEVDGLTALLQGMSHTTKEAALEWCVGNDVPTVALLVHAEEAVCEFIAHMQVSGVKPGGVQDKTLKKRLKEAACAAVLPNPCTCEGGPALVLQASNCVYAARPG